jgi:hypothetical protein
MSYNPQASSLNMPTMAIPPVGSQIATQPQASQEVNPAFAGATMSYGGALDPRNTTTPADVAASAGGVPAAAPAPFDPNADPLAKTHTRLGNGVTVSNKDKFGLGLAKMFSDANAKTGVQAITSDVNAKGSIPLIIGQEANTGTTSQITPNNHDKVINIAKTLPIQASGSVPAASLTGPSSVSRKQTVPNVTAEPARARKQSMADRVKELEAQVASQTSMMRSDDTGATKLHASKAAGDPMLAQLADGAAPSAYRYKPGYGEDTTDTHVGPMAQNMAANPVTSVAVTRSPENGMLALDGKKSLKLALGGMGYLAKKQQELEARLAGRQ